MFNAAYEQAINGIPPTRTQYVRAILQDFEASEADTFCLIRDFDGMRFDAMPNKRHSSAIATLRKEASMNRMSVHVRRRIPYISKKGN